MKLLLRRRRSTASRFVPADRSLLLRALGRSDAAALSAMLQRQSDEYLRFFRPFDFDETSIEHRLENVRLDLYFGFFWSDQLIGFFMLRGWDEGYKVPAYGVVIDEAYRGLGLARTSVSLAKTVTRLRGASRLMLKVHPENRVAKRLYEDEGFEQQGIDPRNENLVYVISIAPGLIP
jgi:RimJ/RimL family protein N-acetyltransferase